LHDAIQLENLGIPTVAVATHEFRAAAGIQGAALGRPDYAPVFIEHPIQDQSPAEIEGKAARSLPEIIGRLLSG